MVGNCPWYMQLRRFSHHMTFDLRNLSAHNLYAGGDNVHLGDSSALPITQFGSSPLHFILSIFFFNNSFCVPSFGKHLIYGFQLCKTNGATIIFTPIYFQVGDLQTGALHLEGNIEMTRMNDLNCPLLHVLSLFFSSTVQPTLTDWHYLLGHPALSILNNTVFSFIYMFLRTH